MIQYVAFFMSKSLYYRKDKNKTQKPKEKKIDPHELNVHQV